MRPGEERGKQPFSLSMLGWALNEEESIAGYLDRAGRFLNALTADYELILIDDGSTDRTLEIARECQRTRPWLRVHANGRNCGSGYNTKRAIALALKDYLFWQTVDWSYDITRLGESLHLPAPSLPEMTLPEMTLPGPTVLPMAPLVPRPPPEWGRAGCG
jgi:hypothetical protein